MNARRDRKREVGDDDESETKTRETHKAKSVAVRESRIWGEFILRQCFGVVFYRGRIICVD